MFLYYYIVFGGKIEKEKTRVFIDLEPSTHWKAKFLALLARKSFKQFVKEINEIEINKKWAEQEKLLPAISQLAKGDAKSTTATQ